MSDGKIINIGDIINERPIGRYRAGLFGLSLVLAMLDGIDNVTLGLAAPAITAELGVPRQALASVFTATLLGLALGAFVLGWAGDRWGRRPSTLVCAALLGIFTSAVPMAPSITSMMILRFLAGIGIGGLLPNICSLVCEFAPRIYRQSAVLVISGGIAAGAMLGGAIASFAEPLFGWRALFYIAGGTTVVALAGAYCVLPESIRFLVANDANRQAVAKTLLRMAPKYIVQPGAIFELEDAQAGHGRVSQLFSRGLAGTTILLWTSYVIVLAVVYLFFQWLPTLAKDFGFSAQMAVFALSSFNFGGAIGSFLLGPIARNRGMYRVAPVNFLLVGPSVLLIAYSQGSPFMLSIGAFAAGWTVMGGLGIINTVAADNYPTEVRSTGIGWASGIGRLGSAISPSILGWLLTIGWDARDIVLLPVVPAMIIALATLSIGVLRRRRKDGLAGLSFHA